MNLPKRNRETGEWDPITSRDAKRMAAVIGAAFLVGSATVAAKAQMDGKASVQEVAALREDVRSLVAVACLDLSPEKRILARLRCDGR